MRKKKFTFNCLKFESQARFSVKSGYQIEPLQLPLILFKYIELEVFIFLFASRNRKTNANYRNHIKYTDALE